MPKEYSTKFKTEVIKRYQNGESILALSQELRIAQSTIYHWRKEFCSIKAANRIYTPKEFDALSRRLEKLEHEMEIIKRSGYIADVPLQKKLSVLENIYRQADNTYSVHELCEALDIARGTFYNYIFRRADHSKREEAQIELMRLVQQVFDDSSQRFGAEKIRVTLAGSGVRVSTKRIAAIMQELGLQSIRPDAKKQYKKQQQYKKQNLLERQFTADHPNQIWVSDITYFKVNDYWMYLHHPRSFLTPNRRLSSIPQCQYKSGHQHIPNRFPGTRQSQWLDFSQRPRQAVHIGRIYSIAAKM